MSGQWDGRKWGGDTEFFVKTYPCYYVNSIYYENKIVTYNVFISNNYVTIVFNDMGNQGILMLKIHYINKYYITHFSNFL